ncbi:hypothetical protein [Catellatospora vulcania]|nr:hypothetical protein [Catellatospora vulcania]
MDTGNGADAAEHDGPAASRQSGRWFVGPVATPLVRLGRRPVVVVP